MRSVRTVVNLASLKGRIVWQHCAIKRIAVCIVWQQCPINGIAVWIAWQHCVFKLQNGWPGNTVSLNCCMDVLATLCL